MNPQSRTPAPLKAGKRDEGTGVQNSEASIQRHPDRGVGQSPTANRVARMAPKAGTVGVRFPASNPQPAPHEDRFKKPESTAPDQAAPLPCLSSNNSIETGAKPLNGAVSGLSQQRKKSACALAWNIQAMAEKYGLDRLAFFTLTFRENLECREEAQRRFNSLRTNVLRKRYVAGIRVVERQRRGAVHYHCLIVLDADIRSGYSWERDKANPRGFDPQAPQALRDEWAFWRETAPKYGFGRCEMKPIASTEEGIARYVGKYLGKHYKARKETDKGWRLAEYWGDARIANTRFSWATTGALEWRAKLRLFAQIMGEARGRPILDISDLTDVLGPRWAYHYREMIIDLPVRTTAPGTHLEGDGSLIDTATGEVIYDNRTREPRKKPREESENRAGQPRIIRQSQF